MTTEWTVTRPPDKRLFDRIRIVTLTYKSESCGIDKVAKWKFNRWTHGVTPLNETANAFRARTTPQSRASPGE